MKLSAESLSLAAAVIVALFALPAILFAQDESDKPDMGFFITGEGSGEGGDLGGPGGADAHCQALAAKAGAGHPWNAAHSSRGCSQEALVSTGGDGLFYCFAAD